MKLEEILSVVREMNITNDESCLTFKAAVCLFYGINKNTVSALEIQLGTGYAKQEVEKIINNLSGNGIIQDNKYCFEYNDDSENTFMEFILCAMAGGGEIVRTAIETTQSAKEEQPIEAEKPEFQKDTFPIQPFDPNELTIEQFEELFPTDKSARDFFELIRWRNHPKCPHCGGYESYSLGCGVRYKCADCLKKYSVSVQSLLNYSKISLRTWLIAVFAYQKSRKLISSTALAVIIECPDSTAFMIKNRLTTIFHPIIEIGKTAFEILLEACNNFFLLKDKYIPSKALKKSIFHVDGTLDLSNPDVYDRLLLHTKTRLRFCNWIKGTYLVPEEVLNEAYIQLCNYPANERNQGEFIVKVINRTIAKLWYEYKKANPIRYEEHLKYNREWKQEARKKLKTYYIAQIESSRLVRKGLDSITTIELRQDQNLNAEIKNRILRKRLNNFSHEFESHLQ